MCVGRLNMAIRKIECFRIISIISGLDDDIVR